LPIRRHVGKKMRAKKGTKFNRRNPEDGTAVRWPLRMHSRKSDKERESPKCEEKEEGNKTQ